MKLDTAKAADFRERRVQIQNGILNICEQWAQVGKWLADVKERDLYKHDPDNPEQTWKAFCERVCGFSRRKADQLIQSTNVRQAIAEAFGSEGMSMVPITERATREYAKVEPQQAAKDIKATVAANQKPTATTAKAARKAREIVIDADTGKQEPTYTTGGIGIAMQPDGAAVQTELDFTVQIIAPEDKYTPGDSGKAMEWFKSLSAEEKGKQIMNLWCDYEGYA